jgi:hypothetical protein
VLLLQGQQQQQRQHQHRQLAAVLPHQLRAWLLLLLLLLGQAWLLLVLLLVPLLRALLALRLLLLLHLLLAVAGLCHQPVLLGLESVLSRMRLHITAQMNGRHVRVAIKRVSTACLQLQVTAWHSCCQLLLLQSFLKRNSQLPSLVTIIVCLNVIIHQQAACMLRVLAGDAADAQTLIHAHMLRVTRRHAAAANMNTL